MAVEAPLAPATTGQAFLVAERPDIELPARAEAARLIKSAGVLALQTTVEIVEPKSAHYNNLREAAKSAKHGDEKARPFVYSNVQAEGVEQVYKTHVRTVRLEVDADGDISQNGQKYSQTLVHALAFGTGSGESRERAEAETRFGPRLAAIRRAGLLQNNYAVLVSRYSDRMTDKEAAAAHLFVDAKSCSIQVVGEDQSGIQLEAAFMAGVPEHGGERHDRKAVAHIGDKLNVNLDGDATATLDKVVIVPKELMPNGVIDLMRWFDEGAGGTFMGEDKPAMDYHEYAELCRQREADLEANVNEVTDLLIEHADEYAEYMDPLYAMRDMLKERLVGVLIINPGMDDRVYGAKAQKHIRKSRRAYFAGRQEEALSEFHKAVETANPTGCPILDRSTKNETTDDHDSLGSRYFPCPKGHINYRRIANVPETKCRVCGIGVGCEPPKIPDVSAGRTTKANILGKKERYGNTLTVMGQLSLVKT